MDDRFYFEWRSPRVYRYRVANPGIRAQLNRYPGCIIGAALVLRHHAYCVLWGAPGATR